ncbi:MAG TPA: GTP 3',8-cyclase MoaA [Actinomycetota bacterium]|nr:GTP 3',8-cyclase MoaA [Actinomycetota bacterium]
MDEMVGVVDRLGRPLRDLRISVTDRCNFRCGYCMPRDAFGRDYQFVPRAQLLTFEEIVRVTRLFRALGVNKVRVTGGEPLLRRDLPDLIAMLGDIDGLELALTTNGSLLARFAEPLARAGLDRVTVSLDSLDDEIFASMNDVRFPVKQVLEGIAAADAAGLAPVKINTVIKRGVNDRGILDIVRRFRGTGHIVRFIEYMDVGTTNGWRREDVVSAEEILGAIDGVYPLEALPPNYPGEVVSRYRYVDGTGEIGVIPSVTKPFCRACTRARLSAEGELFTCLFASNGRDLRSIIRGGGGDEELADAIAGAWKRRSDRYSEVRALEAERGEGNARRKVEMSYIGG